MEIIESTVGGFIVKLPNGYKANVNKDGKIQYVINPSEQEIREEERKELINAFREVLREELKALKTDIVKGLKK